MPEYQVLAPGVHIERIEPTGPIVGVGTSVAAFLGMTALGANATPGPVFNWTEFVDGFGQLGTAQSHLAPAVRGFFDNGGTRAWVVRVGGPTRAFSELTAVGTGTALVVRAREPGDAGNAVTVNVDDSSIVPLDPTKPAQVRRASAVVKSAAQKVITLTKKADAEQFARGDTVVVGTGTDTARVLRVDGTQLVLDRELAASTDAAVRIADLAAKQRSFRVAEGGGIEAGTVLHLAQGSTNEDVVVEAVVGDQLTLEAPGLTNTYKLTDGAAAVALTSIEFALTISGPSGAEPTVPGLSMDARHSRYVLRTLSSEAVEVALPEVPNTSSGPTRRPKKTSAPVPLAKGAQAPASLSDTDWTAALQALERVDEVSVVCLPGVVDHAVQQLAIDHCEKLADRFAILDAPQAETTPPTSPVVGVLEHRGKLSSPDGYAALYHPWIEIADPADRTGKARLAAPPSGHVAGIYARSDARQGVHKAPANEVIVGAAGLRYTYGDAEHGMLNQNGVNLLRTFPGRSAPLLWGARTIAEETAWRYLNVRRLFLYLEESIQEGLRWAPFQTNDTILWKRLERSVSEFLDRVWRSGALFGAVPEDAYYVRVGPENNPPARRELGEVVIEVGAAPVRPAEFVIVKIGIWAGPAGSGS